MTARLVTEETLTCGRCGFDWLRTRTTGPKPPTCPDCRAVAAPRPRVGGGHRNRALPGVDVTTAAYRVAAAAVTYRLAIEEATAALRLGRPAAALAALVRVEAPARRP